MRLFVHLLSESCEAAGTVQPAASCAYWEMPGGYVKACTPAHAAEADARLTALTEAEADSLNAMHYYEGEPYEGEEVIE